MNNAQHNYITYCINRGVSIEQACAEASKVVVPVMVSMEEVRIMIGEQAYKVFRGGPDSDPWYNFSKTV